MTNHRHCAGLEKKLLDPDLVRIFVAEWRARRKERLAGEGKRRQQLERRRAEADRKVQRLVAALADDALAGMAEIRSALLTATTDRDAAAAELEQISAEKVIALHPRLADDYRERVAALAAATVSGASAEQDLEVRNAIRSLIERIMVSPNPDGRGTVIDVEGLLANLLQLATDKPASMYAFAGAPGPTRTDTSLDNRF